MPWHVDRSDSCPESKPWAVIKDDGGDVEGCHETEQEARRQMAALYSSEETSKTVDHVTLKAVATPTTDEGVFEAVISTQGVDREKDIVEPDAMVAALKKWNRPIPLAWNHSTDAKDIIGSVEPMTVRAVDGEVVVGGTVDLDSEVGQEAWRSFKSRTIGFSFGYLILEASNRKGGGRHITGLDVFEVTATPVPANNETRVLATKAAELKQESNRIERELQEAGLPDVEAVKANIEYGEEVLAALELFEPDEVAGLKAGLLKAVWSAAYVNSLPDSSFLYIEPGGDKDEDGRTTPRSLRHFPYKDANGTVDLPHLRNALARIPQSSLAQPVKDRLTARAQRILDNQKMADGTDKGPNGARSVDPLRKRSDDLALEVVRGNVDLRESPDGKQVEEERPEPEKSLRDLRRESYDLMFSVLSGR